MTVNGSYELNKPEDMEATITLTMTVGEWESFRDQLQKGWPANEVGYVITSLVATARKTFWAETEADDEA